MQKLTPPTWLEHYRETLSMQCCFTCYNFNNPYCEYYNQEVPQAGAETVGACPGYNQSNEFDIPF